MSAFDKSRFSSHTLRAWSLAAAMTGAAGLLAAPTAGAQALFSQCAEDMADYCSEVVPGDGRVMACLYAHTATLTESCHAATEGVGLLMEGFFDRLAVAAEACAEDRARLCKDAAPGTVLLCMRDKATELSEGCASALKTALPGS